MHSISNTKVKFHIHTSAQNVPNNEIRCITITQNLHIYLHHRSRPQNIIKTRWTRIILHNYTASPSSSKVNSPRNVAQIQKPSPADTRESENALTGGSIILVEFSSSGIDRSTLDWRRGRPPIGNEAGNVVCASQTAGCRLFSRHGSQRLFARILGLPKRD